MTALEVHLDEAALLARLRGSDVRRGVRREAEAVAGEVDRQGITVGSIDANGGSETKLPVLVQETDDSNDGSLGIYLAHPAGVAVEAADGALQRAASARGLQLQAGEPEQI